MALQVYGVGLTLERRVGHGDDGGSWRSGWSLGEGKCKYTYIYFEEERKKERNAHL